MLSDRKGGVLLCLEMTGLKGQSHISQVHRLCSVFRNFLQFK